MSQKIQLMACMSALFTITGTLSGKILDFSQKNAMIAIKSKSFNYITVVTIVENGYRIQFWFINKNNAVD